MEAGRGTGKGMRGAAVLSRVTVALTVLACSDPVATPAAEAAADVRQTVVDTGQNTCYDALNEIACPAAGSAFHGQDAQHHGAEPSYTVHGDGTDTDDNTGLMWTQSPDLNGDGRIDSGDKLSYSAALAHASEVRIGGHDDWRVPTIHELYSLMDFRGQDISGAVTGDARPFLDTGAFEFGYGATTAGERAIDAQFATRTLYTSTTMGGNTTMFGVNFADGRIKGYPAGATPMDPGGKGYYVLFVRGGEGYGTGDYVDNDDRTVTDRATGLMWSKHDSGTGMDWKEALAWVEARNAEGYLGHSDWRLPDAKELQGLVDYTRSPDATGSAAIDPVFEVTAIVDEAGLTDYPMFWTATTHASTSPTPGGYAVYIAFGRAMGYFEGHWQDVHGAGSQRSDPKVGDARDWPWGHGPQGDAIRIDNYVRLVRDAG